MIPTDMARDPTRSSSQDRPASSRPWLVVYDSDCGFCRWSLAQLLRLDRDRRLEPVALGTPTAEHVLEDLTPEQREASWHLVAPSGRRWSAGAAAPPLLRLLRGGQAPAAVLAALPRMTERGYRWVADHRSLFSKLIPAGAKRRADQRIAATAGSRAVSH